MATAIQKGMGPALQIAKKNDRLVDNSAGERGVAQSIRISRPHTRTSGVSLGRTF